MRQQTPNHFTTEVTEGTEKTPDTEFARSFVFLRLGGEQFEPVRLWLRRSVLSVTSVVNVFSERSLNAENPQCAVAIALAEFCDVGDAGSVAHKIFGRIA